MSPRWTCSARWSRSPRGCRRSWPNASSEAGADARLDAHLKAVRERAAELRSQGEDPQFEARRVVEDLALALQAIAARTARPAGGRRRVLRDSAGGPGRPGVRHTPGRRRRRGDHRARVPGLSAASAARGRRRVRVRRADRPPHPEPSRAREWRSPRSFCPSLGSASSARTSTRTSTSCCLAATAPGSAAAMTSCGVPRAVCRTTIPPSRGTRCSTTRR